MGSRFNARNWATVIKLDLSSNGYSYCSAHCFAISPPSGRTPKHAPAPRKGVHFPALMRRTRISQSSSLNKPDISHLVNSTEYSFLRGSGVVPDQLLILLRWQ